MSVGTIGQPPKKPAVPYQQKSQAMNMAGTATISAQNNAVSYNVGNPGNVHSQNTGISPSVYPSTTYPNVGVGNSLYNSANAVGRPKINQAAGKWNISLVLFW